MSLGIWRSTAAALSVLGLLNAAACAREGAEPQHVAAARVIEPSPTHAPVQLAKAPAHASAEKSMSRGAAPGSDQTPAPRQTAADRDDANPSGDKTADGGAQQQYPAVASARTRTELALRDAKKVIVADEATRTEIFTATQAADQKAAAALATALQEEQKKPVAEQSAPTIANLNTRSAEITAEWAKYLNTERPAIDARYAAANRVVTDVNTAFAGVQAMETSWKNLELDLTPVQKAYDGLTQRLTDARQEMAKSVEDLRQKQTLWNATADKVATELRNASGGTTHEAVAPK